MATSYTSNKKIGALDAASTPLAATNEVVINQNGDILKTPLSAVEAKVFDAKTATSSPTGTEVVVVRQTDNTLRQVALADIVPALNITNAKVSASAAIEDTKLATINTAGKVTNNAVQAVSTNTANRIVTRDGSGNFEAGTITASLSGNASTATSATLATSATALATGRTIALTGDVTYTSPLFNGSANVTAAATIANNAVTTAKIADANVTTAKIADANVTTAKIADSAVTSAKIADGTIVNADINGSAAIALSKLATGALPTAITIASANIVDGTIVDADVSASAAIALSKLATGALPAAITVSSANMVTATAQALLPAGAVMPFAMNSAPSGWLAADGSPVSRTTYAALFAAIGVTHGAGDSVSTFNLPDLRGVFVRGAGTQTISGTDYTGTFGDKQNDLLKNHTHNHTDLTPNSSQVGVAGGANLIWQASSTNATRTTTNPNASLGGTETRPANIALLYCIKF